MLVPRRKAGADVVYAAGTDGMLEFDRLPSGSTLGWLRARCAKLVRAAPHRQGLWLGGQELHRDLDGVALADCGLQRGCLVVIQKYPKPPTPPPAQPVLVIGLPTGHSIE